MTRAAALSLALLVIPGCSSTGTETCGNWSLDADGDGEEGAAFGTCDPPEGAAQVPGGDDCDDADAGVYPGAPDGDAGCDGVDNDCDGQIDENVTLSTWYPDADGDGYGADGEQTTLTSCESTDGLVALAGDCDDEDAAVAPGTFDLCSDGRDQNCDGIDDCALQGELDLTALIAAGGGWQLGGVSFAVVGDVDGDGLDDVAVGVPNVDAVRLVSGSTGAVFQTISGEILTDFGAALAAADFDGDGDLDLAVGAPAAAAGAGELTIWYGPSFAGSTAIAALSGDTMLGFALVAVPAASGPAGLCAADLYTGHREESYYIYCFDAPSQVSTAALVDDVGPFEVVDGWPLRLAAATLDGGPVLAVGYSGGDTPGVKVYDLPYTSGDAVRNIFGTTATGTSLGATVALYDVDGSGEPDLLVGAPEDGKLYGLLDPAASTASYTPGTADLIWTGSSSDALGAGVALLGDLDGDGDRELAIGGADALWIFYGRESGFPLNASAATAVLSGFSGPVRALADAGDVNGDAFGDILVCDGTVVTLLFGGPPA